MGAVVQSVRVCPFRTAQRRSPGREGLPGDLKLVHMAERASCNTSSGGPSGRSGAVVLRVVTRQPVGRRTESSAPEWAPATAMTGGWSPDEGLVPFGAELPFEPDPEAAAFLNAPRRTLDFYVAPFGTPPFGNAAGNRRPDAEPVRRGGTQWGQAYPAGA